MAFDKLNKLQRKPKQLDFENVDTLVLLYFPREEKDIKSKSIKKFANLVSVDSDRNYVPYVNEQGESLECQVGFP